MIRNDQSDKDSVIPPTVSMTDVEESLTEQVRELQTEATIRKQRHINEVEKIKSDFAEALHHEISGYLTLINLHTLELGDHINTDPEAQKTYNHLQDVTGALIKKAKIIQQDLYPTALRSGDLLDALVLKFAEFSFIKPGIQFEFALPEKLSPLKSEIGLGLYRITQEALNNVIKHSKASMVSIMLVDNVNIRKIQLTVADNGVGAGDLSPSLTTRGLGSMQDRVDTLGGQFYFVSNETTGTTITVSIPY